MKVILFGATGMVGQGVLRECLLDSDVSMNETDYARVTYDFTLAAAKALAKVNPRMTFIYVSGAGTDSSEKGRSMWARVKGRTENALLALPFKATFMFRLGFIQPMHGIVSKTKLYRVVYTISAPLFPVLNAAFPKAVTTSERVGRAMLAVAKRGFGKTLLENADINALAAGSA